VVILQISLLFVIFGISVAGRNRSVNEYLPTGRVRTSDYKIDYLPDAIVKLSTDKVLVYLKPIIGFYSSDHQPTMCWKGSGYEFRKLETVMLDGQEIYTSSLEKAHDKLYTAWWYDNGSLQSISQLTWRWDSFSNNRPWVLVNVTAGSERELFNQIRLIKRLHAVRMLLKAGEGGAADAAFSIIFRLWNVHGSTIKILRRSRSGRTDLFRTIPWSNLSRSPTRTISED